MSDEAKVAPAATFVRCTISPAQLAMDRTFALIQVITPSVRAATGSVRCRLVASDALLRKNPRPSEEEVRFWLAGNLCRCTGYDKIVRAVLETAEEMREAAQ